MAPAEHTCSIHIDAPPEKVFAYIEDPVHFIAAMPANHHATVGAVTRTPQGMVTTYECRYRELGMHPTGGRSGVVQARGRSAALNGRAAWMRRMDAPRGCPLRRTERG